MISARRLTAELHVEVLGLDLLHRRADPDPGVVDEHVEAAVGLAVLGEDADDVVLVGHVGGDALDLEARRRAGPRRRPRASPGGARRRSARSPPRRACVAIARPMPLEAPVISAARSATSSLLALAVGSRGTLYARPRRITWPRCASARIAPRPRLPARGRGAARRLRRRLRLDRLDGGTAAKAARRRRRATSRAPKGKTLARGAQSRRRAARTGRLAGRAWSSTRARTATRSASSNATAPRSPTPKSPSTSPRCRKPKPGAKSKSGQQGPGARRPRNRRSTSRRSARSRPRSKASRPSPPSARRRPADDPDAATRRLLDRTSTSPATASGGSRR